MSIRQYAEHKLQRILERVERRAQMLQGKGWSANTIRQEVRAALPFIPPGAIVFDAGANVGKWTRELLDRAGDRVARIHLFEPSTDNIAALAAISDPRLVLVPCALGDRPGEATLFSNAPGSGLASLSQRDLRFAGIAMDIKQTVRVETLDAYADRNKIERIDFLKLDIEGHELAAMRGAERLFADGAIRALAFEFGGTSLDTRIYFKDFYYFLTERGFRIWRINPYRSPTPIRRYSEMHEIPQATNFLSALQR